MSGPGKSRVTKIDAEPWYDAELEAAVPADPPRRPWSDTDDAKLRHYYPRGVLLRDLAKSLGRSENAVRYRATHLGLRRGQFAEGEADG